MMSPADQYTNIAMNYIAYLNTFLSNYLGALNIGIPNMQEFCEELREHSFS